MNKSNIKQTWRRIVKEAKAHPPRAVAPPKKKNWWPLPYSETALSFISFIDMNHTDVWMQDQCITKSPPTDKNRKGNGGHSSMPQVGFQLMMSTEWLNKACLSPVYLIMGSRPHTTFINCTKY
jgi:hypothetical protein